MILYAPKSYKNMDSNLRALICDGLRAKYSFLPETILGLSIKDACSVLYFMYNKAEHTIEGKYRADRVFLNNTLRIIEACTDWKGLTALRYLVAYSLYFKTVLNGGVWFWSDKNKLENMYDTIPRQ